MTDILSNILLKLSVKEIGKHLRSYTDLYLKPIEAWKKTFNNDKSGYNFTVLHIIYYCLLILLISQNIYLSIQLVIVEIIITFIPLLFFLFPFKISTRIFKIRKNWISLFRTFLIIKFQFIPPFVFIFLIAKWSSFYALYIIPENILWFLWLEFIIIVPILCVLKVWQKIVWIVINYIFFLLGMLFLVYIMSHFNDSKELFKKLSLHTPNMEYLNLKFENNQLIRDNEIVTILQITDSDIYVRNIRPANAYITLAISQNSRNKLIKELRIIDSIGASRNPRYIKKSSKYKIDEKVVKISISFLDSFYNDFDKKYDDNLRVYSQAKDSSYYNINKEYFKYCYENLFFYKKIFTDMKLIKHIIITRKPKDIIHIENGYIVVLYELDSTYIYPNKNKLNLLENKLDTRLRYSSFMMNFMIYPLDYIMNKIEI